MGPCLFAEHRPMLQRKEHVAQLPEPVGACHQAFVTDAAHVSPPDSSAAQRNEVDGLLYKR